MGSAEAGPRMGDGRWEKGVRSPRGLSGRSILVIKGMEAGRPRGLVLRCAMSAPRAEPEHTSRSEGPRGSWGLKGNIHRASCGCAGRERRALPAGRSLESGHRPRPLRGRASWQRPLASARGAQNPRDGGGPGAAPHILTRPPAPGAAPGAGRRVLRLEGYVTENERLGPRLNPQASTSVPPLLVQSQCFVWVLQLNHPTFCAFLVAQRLKHLPAMRETWVRSLDQEDPLEKEMATHSSILAMDRGAWWATVNGVTKSRTQLSDFTLT